MSRSRRALGTFVTAALAIGAVVATPGDARAGSGEDIALAGLGAGLLGFLGADIAFAAHDLDAAIHNNLIRDDWLPAEAVVTVPQTLLFNTLLLGLNTDNDEDFAILGTALGTLPTAGVTALTTHGFWGIADKNTDADAMAGISVIVGTNVALTMSAIGRATQRRVHSRGIGIFTTALATPGTVVGIYESTFSRPQQPAWIGLTAWSGALFVHGVVSMIVDGKPRSSEPPPEAASRGLQRGPKGLFAQASFTVAPTVLSDGGRQMPGIVAGGVF